jgi:hypothetical protein
MGFQMPIALQQSGSIRSIPYQAWNSSPEKGTFSSAVYADFSRPCSRAAGNESEKEERRRIPSLLFFAALEDYCTTPPSTTRLSS